MPGDDLKNISNILGEPKKALISMSIPIIIGMMVQSLNNFIDAIWVSGIGTGALAATGVVFPFFFILVGIGNGLGIGASQSISKHIAIEDKNGANKAAAHILVIGAIVGIFLAIIFALFARPIFSMAGANEYINETLDYGLVTMIASPVYLLSFIFSALMRSEGSARMSMNLQIISVTVHMMLDPILIYGMNMRIEGAAIASVISIATSVVIAILCYYRNNMYIKPTFHPFKFELELDKDILRVGIPASLETIFISISTLIMNMIIVLVDPINGIAVYTIGWRILDLLMLPAMSFGSALVPIAAAGYGCKTYERIRDAYKYAIIYGEAIIILLILIVLVAAPYIVHLFTYNESTFDLAGPMTEFIRIGCIFLPFTLLGVVTSSLFQSVGRGITSMIATVFRNTIHLPICFVLSGYMSLTMLWWGITLSEIIGGIVVALGSTVTLKIIYESFNKKNKEDY